MCDGCSTTKTVTLSDDNLPQLRDRIKDNPVYLKVYAETVARLNGIINGFDFIVDSWPDFKAVVSRPNSAIEFEFLNNIVNVSGDDPNVVKGLLSAPDVLDWSKKWMFAFVDNSLTSGINDLISQHCGKASTSELCYVMETTEGSLNKLPIPEGCQVKPLALEDADLVNKHWPFAQGDMTYDYIKNLIDTRPSCCLYDQDRSVVGFAMCYHYGALGMLHVMGEHRGKGYGKFIMSYLANECLTRGHRALVVVEENNPVSFKLHETIGFRKIPDRQVSWIGYTPKGCCSGPTSCCV